MAKTYLWKATTRYQSTTTMSYGVNPSTQSDWQIETPGQRSGSWGYWYRDANVLVGGQYTDANSSRATINLTESWTASIDSRNYLTISITTTINSIVRDDLRGQNQNTPGRNINIYREQGGSPVLSITDNQVATARTVWTGPLVLDNFTFTLAPGQSLERSSLYLHNQVVGLQSYDDIWFGVQFQNPLPKDHRVGASLDTNTGVWKSHNRLNGACHVLSNTSAMTWKEMRNIGDGTNKGDAPLILKGTESTDWYDQRNLGRE